MAQAPTYASMKKAQQDQELLNQEVANQGQTRADSETSQAPNDMLQAFMNKQAQAEQASSRLGEINPAQYSMAAAQAENAAGNYSANMLDKVLNQGLEPEVMLNDPQVNDNDKLYVLNLMKQTQAANAPAPVQGGLGQLFP